uniref:Ig-like domain-containing protein n=1 Tax=Poecilia formosa TaxID=48698 RepID=A0A096LZ72_POEFO
IYLTGVENVELFFYETMEAEVGQNITLPCFVKDATDQKIVSIKWTKNEGTNLAVYNPDHGTHQYWPNVTIQEKRNDANKLIGSDLHLPWVNKWDSGIYICEILKFPPSSLNSKTKLTVKDIFSSRLSDPTQTTEHPTNSLHTSTPISLTTTLPTDTQWTTQPNSSTVGVPASEHVTPPATSTSVSVPDTQTITNFLLNSSMLNNDVTELTSTQRMASDVTKNESRFNRQSTENMFSMSTTESGIAGSIESNGTISTELITTICSAETERSHILLVFIIVLLLLLILVVVILYRKQIIKKRMDLPPPFKPPPPPVKYTAARRSETEL